MDDQLLHPSRILVVDDQEANALLLQAVLDTRRLHRRRDVDRPDRGRCSAARSSRPTWCCSTGTCQGGTVSELLEDIAFLTEEPNWMPVLVVTADIAPETKRRALSLGARDFLTKPIDVFEVLLRVRNLLQTRFLRVELAAQQRAAARARLAADAASSRTHELEMLDRLALAAEYRDDATGQHSERIGRTSELLAARARPRPGRRRH